MKSVIPTCLLSSGIPATSEILGVELAALSNLIYVNEWRADRESVRSEVHDLLFRTLGRGKCESLLM